MSEKQRKREKKKESQKEREAERQTDTRTYKDTHAHRGKCVDWRAYGEFGAVVGTKQCCQRTRDFWCRYVVPA